MTVATWNKYRTLKNNLDHEAVKEYWEEGGDDVLGQLLSGRAVQCSPEVLQLLHQRKQTPIVVNKLKGDYK